jgi:peptide/nickel transport system substrate-binding protein
VKHCVLAVVATAALAGPAVVGASADATRSAAAIPLLRIGSTLAPTTIDPTKHLNANIVNQLALDTLLKLTPSERLEPSLATSWKQTSPVTYVYQLRHGVKFWDGKELTSADVAYSLDYEGRPGNVGAFGKFANFKSATASGLYTVVVRLTAPNAGWQYTPAFPQAGIFEKAFALAHPGTFGEPGTLTMGSGPWEVTSLDPTTGVELSANPSWWGGKVNVQKISIAYFSSETSLAIAMRAGQIDFDPQVGAPKSFASTADVHILTSPNSCSVGFFSMNVQAAPWSDVHVRRAVAYAIDRTSVIAANGGYATPNYTFIPGGALSGIASQAQINGLLASVPHYAFSLAKAKQELAKSAYPHGFSATTLNYNLGNSVNIIQVIDADLAKIGIKVTPRILPLGAWLANVGGVPASTRSTTVNSDGGCSSPDPSGYDAYLRAENLKSGQYNLAAYAPASVDGWLTAGVATSSPAKRFGIYAKAIRQMAVDEPYVPLFTADYSVAISSKFKLAPGLDSYWYLQAAPYALGISPSG